MKKLILIFLLFPVYLFGQVTPIIRPFSTGSSPTSSVDLTARDSIEALKLRLGPTIYPPFGIGYSNGSAWSASLSTSGSGSTVALTNSPIFTTPQLGSAMATSINKMAIIAPATSSTLRIYNGKTFSAINSITLQGVDNSTLDIGAGGLLGSLAFLNATDYTNNTTLQTYLDLKVNTNDARLTNSRQASDVSAWAKAATKPTYTETEIGFTDITTGNASTTKHGYLPKLTGVASDVLKGNGTFGAAITDTASTDIAGLKTLLGVTNVDNTTDANKPVSSATQTALNGKQNIISKINLPGTYAIPFTNTNTQILPFRVISNLIITPDTLNSISGSTVALDLIGDGSHTVYFSKFKSGHSSAIDSFIPTNNYASTYQLQKIGKYTYKYQLENFQKLETWRDLLNMSLEGETGLRKTSANGWDGGARSVKTLTGAGYAEFKLGTNYFAVGFSDNTTVTGHYNTIDRAINFDLGNTCTYYTAGTSNGTFSGVGLNTNTLFKLERTAANVVNLYADGVLKATFPGTFTGTMWVQVGAYSINMILSSITFSSEWQ